MDKKKIFQTQGIFLDLAVEAHDLLRGDAQREVSGVVQEKTSFPHGSTTTIRIVNEQGEELMGRPKGTYITIESPELRKNNWEAHKNISQAFASSLRQLVANFHLGPEDVTLLVGLGNWNATPDALGPKVIGSVLVTRHLFHYAPDELSGGLRPVCAVAPGVLGITGIETAEIIKGIVEHVKPRLLIAIDALAAGNVDRIASTIQLADTGISPGSGIGNKRAGINQETMNIPVIAIGVPTVVNAITIAFELFNQTLQNNQQLANFLQEDTINQTVHQVLGSFGGNLTVTPKEIDELINNTARVIASGINQSLHVAINPGDYAMYLH
ncbi:MAG TPA: GPR endopeptidase [Clostridia bacterium]|nr:GPR endopeptidase [Clostridia bacterium]